MTDLLVCPQRDGPVRTCSENVDPRCDPEGLTAAAHWVRTQIGHDRPDTIRHCMFALTPRAHGESAPSDLEAECAGDSDVPVVKT